MCSHLLMDFTFQSLHYKGTEPSVFFRQSLVSVSGYINVQNLRIWSLENLYQYWVTLLHRQKIGVLCTMNFYFDGDSWLLSWTHFQFHITDEEIETTLLLSTRQSAHPFSTINNGSVERTVWRYLISKGWWSARSPDLTQLDCFLWFFLKI